MYLKNFIRQRDNLFKFIGANFAIVNSRSKKVYIARKWKETLLVASIWFVIALVRALPQGFSTKIPVLTLDNNDNNDNNGDGNLIPQILKFTLIR